ncbi:MAG: ABC transporter permease [Bacillota bacterium]
MQVFKAYFLVIKKNLPQMFIYAGIFLALAVMISSLNKPTPAGEFSQSKIRLAIFNNDTKSQITNELKGFLSKNTEIVLLEDNNEKIQDALFFRNVEYIIRIPAGFAESLRSQKAMQIEKTSVPGSTTAIYTDLLINNFINTTLRYVKFEPLISDKGLAENVKKDLEINTKVEMKSFDTYSGNTLSIVYYFNYLSYSLFAILILGVSAFMMVFNNVDLKRRNLCAPFSSKSLNFQIFLGNLVFAVCVFVVLVGFSFVLYGRDMLTTNAALMCLNTVTFTFAAISASFLIGNFASPNSAPAITNVVTLGTCFISGVFVPQQFLGSTVLSVASFTPTFWFVKANNEIGSMINFSSENLFRLGGYMVTELVFAVLFLVIGFFVAKKRRVTKG